MAAQFLAQKSLTNCPHMRILTQLLAQKSSATRLLIVRKILNEHRRKSLLVEGCCKPKPRMRVSGSLGGSLARPEAPGTDKGRLRGWGGKSFPIVNEIALPPPRACTHSRTITATSSFGMLLTTQPPNSQNRCRSFVHSAWFVVCNQWEVS